MSKGTFGDRLKREREMRGVSLEEIATATRISTRFLEALENEQWERLPGGIFNRGFIRSVARFLGLDEDSLVAEYAMATNDPPEVAVWVEGAGQQAQSRRWPWLILALLLLLGSGWFAYRRVSPYFSQISQLSVWKKLPRLVSRAAPLVSSNPAATQKPAVSPPTAPASGEVPGGTVPATAGAAPTSAGTAEVSPSPAAPDSTMLELQVEAGRPTRVSVVADGKALFDGRMSPGQSQRFEAKERFQVSAGDSGAVLLELNGQTLPPLGPPDQPGSATLTRKDLKKLQGGQN